MKRVVRLPSISGVARAEACPGSEVILDRISATSARAERGTELHEFCDAVGVRGVPRDEALAKVSHEWKEVCAAIDVGKVYEGIVSGLRSEVAYAVNVDDGSVRELGHHLARNYPATSPVEAIGSEDYEGFAADDTPVVGDVKTGQYVGRPQDSWQLRLFAYCAIIRTGAERVIGRFTYIGEDVAIEHDSYMFTAEELLDVPAHLQAIRDGIGNAFESFDSTGQLTVNPGACCKYCDGFMSCPAKTSLIAKMGGELTAVRERFAAMTQEEISKAYLTYEEIKSVFYEVEGALKDLAKKRGIELQDGRTVRGVESMRSSFSKDKAIKMLTAKGATAAEIEACHTQTKTVSVRVLGKRVA